MSDELFTLTDAHECGYFCGACDYSYSIKFNRECTVGEFIDYVLTIVNEWGYVGIDSHNDIFGDPHCEYRYGKLLYEMPSDVLDKKVVSANATGGWTRMDYILHLS